MIDDIYQVLKTILNKELRGNTTPAEYNLLARQVQNNIFRGYFEDVNRDKIKENRGFTSKNFSNLSFFQRQRIEQFSSSATLLSLTDPFLNYNLPTDLYFIKDRGISGDGIVIDEVQACDISFQSKSLAAPSTIFPIYERKQSSIDIFPALTTTVTCRYVRKPLDPKWTYTIVSGVELFNNSASDFADFDLHISEFSNIVINMSSYFGINLREVDVIKYAEGLKQNQEIKEEK